MASPICLDMQSVSQCVTSLKILQRLSRALCSSHGYSCYFLLYILLFFQPFYLHSFHTPGLWVAQHKHCFIYYVPGSALLSPLSIWCAWRAFSSTVCPPPKVQVKKGENVMRTTSSTSDFDLVSIWEIKSYIEARKFPSLEEIQKNDLPDSATIISRNKLD